MSRGRWEFGELQRQVVGLADVWRPNSVLVEDAASGQSLVQSLQAETRLPVLPVKPLGDKVARASAVSPIVESGRVYLPESAAWLADFLDEASSFPAAPHDDQIDALSQALNYLRGSGSYVDIEFQQRAQAVFHEQSLLRQEHIDAVPGVRSRGGGFDWARREDAEEARLRTSPRWKFRGF